MNINPTAKRILCYGDSNTHGRDPKQKAEQNIKARFPVGVRWTSLLRQMLGDGFEVIEEGLGGRTTNLDDPDSEKNGLTYLKPCLNSHVPLDLIVLMLGTNDLKDHFNRTAKNVAVAHKQLLGVIKENTPNAQILVLSSIYVDGSHSMAKENYSQATEKSQMLASELQQVANEFECAFLDLAQHVQPSAYDGIHIDQQDQETVAHVIYQKVIELCQ